jgi:hypothetical protein
MADHNFRSDRGEDPIAELARLIVQAHPDVQNAPAESGFREEADAHKRHAAVRQLHVRRMPRGVAAAAAPALAGTARRRSQSGAAASSGAHLATASATLANANSTAEVSPAVSGGGYAVQVSSERSESGARAAFRALQAKYPNQLSGGQPIIRRADLGAAGTYYRALVGPFASAEEATRLCSRLKAAGSNCIIQKN